MKRFYSLICLAVVATLAAVGVRALDIPAGTFYFDNSLTKYSHVKFVYGADASPETHVISMTLVENNIYKVTIPQAVTNMYRYTFAETSIADGTLSETFTSVKDRISNTLNEKRTSTTDAAITIGWVFRPTNGDNWASGVWAKLDNTKPYSGTLPVIFINTENNTPVTSKEEYLTGTYYLDPMGIDGVEAFGTKDEPLALQIKGRGNYTWTGFDKKPYRLKLDKKAGILGMKKSKHFGLLAHADDELGFLRNTMGFEFSKRLGLAWTPDQQPVELVLNGEYLGLYMLTELIRIDADRVNIVEQADYETDPLAITGGWLVEIDNYEETEQVRITEGNGEAMRFTYKTPELLSDQQRAYLTNLVTAADRAIYATDKSSTEWENIIDIDELAKFYIVQELMDNAESFHGSCYWHKEQGNDTKMIFGPVWDFGNSYRRGGSKFIYQDPPYGQNWIGEIAKFPHFQEVVKKYWNQFLAYEYADMTDVIDRFENQIAGAAASDAARWPQYGSRNFANARGDFKNRLAARVNWLKQQWGEPDMSQLRYDVNKDGQVNVGDVASVYQVILDPNDALATRADVNTDGTINVGDVASLYEKILGGGTTPGDDDNFITIHVKADAAPHLYAWTFDPEYALFNGEWPGNVMTETTTVNGISWWTFRIDADKANIIFNNGNSGTGNQTEDINDLTRGTYFFTYDGGEQYRQVDPDNLNPDDPTPDPDPETESNIAIFVKADVAPHLFLWYRDGRNTIMPNGDWPGNVMTETETRNGDTWWVARFDLDNVNIIFNDGNSGVGEHQTEDINGLTRGAHFYTYDGAGSYTVVE